MPRMHEYSSLEKEAGRIGAAGHTDTGAMPFCICYPLKVCYPYVVWESPQTKASPIGARTSYNSHGFSRG